MERTLENLANAEQIYMDVMSWRFYEGGKAVDQIPHHVRLEVFKLKEEKFPTVVVTISNEDRNAHPQEIKIRLAVYEFMELNKLFKRACFRLEKV
jgi:hypothetical protein